MMLSKYKTSEARNQIVTESHFMLECRNIKKEFRSSIKGSFLAVNDVSLSVNGGEVVAIIGESGSGKTTLAKILAGFLEPTSGEVLFMKKPLTEMGKQEMLYFRRNVQYIPQCPDLALDPMWYIYDSIAEPLRIHQIARSQREELEVVRSASSRFGLGLDQLRRKPRDVSGGELQRALLSRSMVLNPKVIIADEPTSMLDPSTQAKIVHQLIEVQKETGLAVLFVTHDLELAKKISDRICVMLGGMIVESGDTLEVFSSPIHPYTSSLISRLTYSSEVVEKTDSACPFYGQCDVSVRTCYNLPPPEFKLEGGRSVRCWIFA